MQLQEDWSRNRSGAAIGSNFSSDSLNAQWKMYVPKIWRLASYASTTGISLIIATSILLVLDRLRPGRRSDKLDLCGFNMMTIREQSIRWEARISAPASPELSML